MGRPLTPDEIIHALKTWGIPYRETTGWRTRSNGTQWGDVTGFMWHHTGDDAPDTTDRKIITYGRPGLSGPLANFGINDDGIVDVISAGPANHAGGGDPRVLEAVRRESYTEAPPAPRYIHGETGSVIGNRLFYGVEVYYWKNLTADAKTIMVRLAAAIIWALDKADGDAARWSSKSAIGHKEWQRGKIDPASFDCPAQRLLVQDLLNRGPGNATPAAPAPQPKDDDMIDEADAKAIFTGFAIVKDARATNPDTAPRVTPSTLLEFGVRVGIENQRRITAASQAVARVEAQVTGLTAALKALADAGRDVDLDQLRTIVDEAVDSALEKSVVVQGDVVITPSPEEKP